MIYIVYKTINLLTGRYYIGKHGQKGLEFDGYLGSGIELNNDINYYGKENFVRTTLYVTTDEENCFEVEYNLTKDVWRLDECYNKLPGGKGFRSGQNHPMYGKKRPIEVNQRISNTRLNGNYSFNHTEEAKNKIGSASKKRNVSDETRKKMSDAAKKRKISNEGRRKLSESRKGEKNHNYGKKFSNVTKQRMRESSSGEKNSRFKGYFHTPWGRFTSSKSAGDYIGLVNTTSVKSWCIDRNDNLITKQLLSNLRTVCPFSENDVGKTFRDLGFWFEPINNTKDTK